MGGFPFSDGNARPVPQVRNEADKERDITDHLQKQFQALYALGEKSECPICLDDINADDLKTRSCGHHYHEKCWTEYEQSKHGVCLCCVCRT